MTTETVTQLTPLFEYLIRGDTLIFPPLVFTQSVLVPQWSAETVIFSGECRRGTAITDYYFQSTAMGVTGSSEPDWGSHSNVDDTVTDGTIEWINKGRLYLTAGTDIAKQPINIIGWKFFVTCKTNQDDTDEEAQVAYEYEFPDSDEAEVGRGNVTIPASIMIGLIPGNVYMDVQLVIPNGNIESIVKSFGLGKIKVYADISMRII